MINFCLFTFFLPDILSFSELMPMVLNIFFGVPQMLSNIQYVIRVEILFASLIRVFSQYDHHLRCCECCFLFLS